MRKESTSKRLTRIHDAAIYLASQGPVDTISIYDVAKQASIAASTVYHHYPNIESLICELMRDVFKDFSYVLKHAIVEENIFHWSDINRMIEEGFVAYYRSSPLVQHTILGQNNVQEK